MTFKTHAHFIHEVKYRVTQRRLFVISLADRTRSIILSISILTISIFIDVNNIICERTRSKILSIPQPADGRCLVYRLLSLLDPSNK